MSLDRGEALESNFNISPPSAFLKSMGWPQEVFQAQRVTDRVVGGSGSGEICSAAARTPPYQNPVQ